MSGPFSIGDAKEEVNVGFVSRGKVALLLPMAEIESVGSLQIERIMIGNPIADIGIITHSFTIVHRDGKGVKNIVFEAVDAICIVWNIEALQTELRHQRNRLKTVFKLLGKESTIGERLFILIISGLKKDERRRGMTAEIGIKAGEKRTMGESVLQLIAE